MYDFVEMGDDKQGHFGQGCCGEEATVDDNTQPAEEFYT